MRAVLRICGIDLDLAPVLDIASEPAKPGDRAASGSRTSEGGCRHAVAFARCPPPRGRGMGKHVPGHGSTAVDRLALPVLDLSARFASAIDAGISALMTGPPLARPGAGGPLCFYLCALTSGCGRQGLWRCCHPRALDMRAVSADLGIGEAGASGAVEAGRSLLCLGNPVQPTTPGPAGATWVVTASRRTTTTAASALLPATTPREAHRALVEAVRSGRVSIQRLAEKRRQGGPAPGLVAPSGAQPGTSGWSRRARRAGSRPGGDRPRYHAAAGGRHCSSATACSSRGRVTLGRLRRNASP